MLHLWIFITEKEIVKMLTVMAVILENWLWLANKMIETLSFERDYT